MATTDRRKPGIPKLWLIVGGFVVLITAVTVLARLGGSPVEQPPPQVDPVVPKAKAEAEVRPPEPSASPPPRTAPRPPPPPPSPPPTDSPFVAPQVVLPPPKRLFADECVDQLFRMAMPHSRPYGANGRKVDQLDAIQQREFRRTAQIRKACECIESHYRAHQITDLRGEDARSDYQDVFKRHGRVLTDAAYGLFTGCEHTARW